MNREGAGQVGQAILHKAEEYGQARELKPGEVLAFTMVSGLKATAIAVAASALIAGGRLVLGEDVSLASILLTISGVGAISLAVNLLGDLDTLVDGLRSWRAVETFAPPQPEPAEPPHPPIVVRPYKGVPYVIGHPALPGKEALQLTPPIVAEILRATVEEHGGEWSRRKLMRLRVAGQQVTRGMYEELTAWLSKAGVLQQKRQGGFTLPPDVREFEDLRRYFPNLPGLGRPGGPGGNREGWEGEPSQSSHSPGRVGTLAERRRQRWLECGCDTQLYRQGGKP